MIIICICTVLTHKFIHHLGIFVRGEFMTTCHMVEIVCVNMCSVPNGCSTGDDLFSLTRRARVACGGAIPLFVLTPGIDIDGGETQMVKVGKIRLGHR